MAFSSRDDEFISYSIIPYYYHLKDKTPSYRASSSFSSKILSNLSSSSQSSGRVSEYQYPILEHQYQFKSPYKCRSTGIGSTVAYDKYGKELSNYERWKLEKENESRALRSERDFGSISSKWNTEPNMNRRNTLGRRVREENWSLSNSLSDACTDVRDKLKGFKVDDVIGDGGCYYRCLSLYFTGSQGSYNKYRREVLNYIRDHLDSYSSMIRSEIGYASTSDYFSRKTRTDRQEFSETTEIIASCVVYNINIHVLALVPGQRHSWEWLHFDPSIGSGKPSISNRNIYLYNQGSVHFQLCTPK